MNRRTATVEETRQRIVEATVSLHGRNGIFGTSWRDIAREADVSVGTVYKHFPTLEELVPACGELLMQRLRPPTPENADRIIGDAKDRYVRLSRVAHELFDFYERGGAHLESDPRERELPAMREWEASLRDLVSAFVARACHGEGLETAEIQRISVMLDLATYRAMRTRELSPEEAVEQAAQMIAAWLEHRGREGRP